MLLIYGNIRNTYIYISLTYHTSLHVHTCTMYPNFIIPIFAGLQLNLCEFHMFDDDGGRIFFEVNTPSILGIKLIASGVLYCKIREYIMSFAI